MPKARGRSSRWTNKETSHGSLLQSAHALLSLKLVLNDKRQPLESYLKIHITALNERYKILIPGLQTGRL